MINGTPVKSLSSLGVDPVFIAGRIGLRGEGARIHGARDHAPDDLVQADPHMPRTDQLDGVVQVIEIVLDRGPPRRHEKEVERGDADHAPSPGDGPEQTVRHRARVARPQAARVRVTAHDGSVGHLEHVERRGFAAVAADVDDDAEPL